jgi:hypothetical protein
MSQAFFKIISPCFSVIVFFFILTSNASFSIGYSNSEIRKIISEKTLGATLAPLLPKEIPVYKALLEIADKEKINILIPFPLPEIKITDSSIKRILKNSKDKIKALQTIADEGLYKVFTVNSTYIVHPISNRHTENIYKGLFNNSIIYRDLHNLELRHLPVMPDKNNLANIPPGVTIEIAPNNDIASLEGKKIPLTWLISTISFVSGKKIRLEEPARGHICVSVKRYIPGELLKTIAPLFDFICIERQDSFDLLKATGQRVNFYNSSNIDRHIAFKWLSMYKERARNNKHFRTYYTGLIDLAYAELKKNNYARSLMMASSVYRKRPDINEALYIMILCHAGAGRFNKALSLLRELKKKTGPDSILDSIEKELLDYINLSIIKGEIKMLE